MMSSKPPKILIAEDDKNMGLLLKENLISAGFAPVLCSDGHTASMQLRQSAFDLCILEMLLPHKDGMELAREIRHNNLHLPIIFLSTSSLPDDKIEGFRCGADDYITKPFNTEEVLWRIRAILKRSMHQVVADENLEIALGSYRFSYSDRTLIQQGKAVRLSAKEAGLLRILALHKFRVVARSTILRHLWGRDDYFTSKSLDVYLSKLRKHLQGDKDVVLQNIHGHGYKLIDRSVGAMIR